MLRSVAAAALLGCCGLLVPSQRALIPFYDSFMIRNFSGDSPMEGRSSFALECVDMKYVLLVMLRLIVIESAFWLCGLTLWRDSAALP